MRKTVHNILQIAKAGDIEKQNELGLFYAGGVGVKQDTITAIKWFKMAAGNEEKTAQFNLQFIFLIPT